MDETWPKDAGGQCESRSHADLWHTKHCKCFPLAGGLCATCFCPDMYAISSLGGLSAVQCLLWTCSMLMCGCQLRLSGSASYRTAAWLSVLQRSPHNVHFGAILLKVRQDR